VFLTVELTMPSNMAVLNSTIMRHVRQDQEREEGMADPDHVFGKPFNGAFATKKRASYNQHDALEDPELTTEERLQLMLKTLNRDQKHQEMKEKFMLKAETEKAFWQFSSAESTFWDATNTHHILPVFSSGKAFVPSTFDSLLCQSFFGTLTPVVCEKIVCGQRAQTIYQIPLPAPFVGEEFKLLFRAFNARCVFIIALYRAACVEDGSALPFVLPCPPSDVVLRKNDKLFVFCNPHRLQYALETCLSLPFKKGYLPGSRGLMDKTVIV